MINKEQLKLERLNSSLQKCSTHLNRLHYASSQVYGLFPLAHEIYLTFSEAVIGGYRFPFKVFLKNPSSQCN